MTTLSQLTDWLDQTLDVGSFSDVSNNGLQIDREGEEVSRVAFAVDASHASVEEAARRGAELLVVHHGISWGGGIARLTGGVARVVRAAMKANLALYAVHLPLDAHEKYGNNFTLARHFGLTDLARAFVYHGETIGVTGRLRDGRKMGICSGGAGAFAEEARRLGCDLYLTGEADWGERIAAENCGMKMILAGHYETETFGVRSLQEALAAAKAVDTVFVGRKDIGSLNISLTRDV